MREIEFRGQYHILETSEWVWMYGCNDWGEIVDKEDDHWRVNESTIGQYIGLKDDNGVKIYEGDVVKVSIKSGLYSRIQMSDQIKIGVVKYNPENTRFSAYIDNNPDHAAVIYIGYGLEVLGNVFDNPEFEKYKEVYFRED